MYTLHLFSGAGGGLLADILLGHTPICAVELEKYPRRVLLQRQLDGVLPVFPVWDDVTSFSIDNPETAGMFDQLRKVSGELAICGGFPCQDISIAGKGKGISGECSGLWKEFARIISEVQPRHVFVENSPLLKKRGLEVVLGNLAEMGYDAAWGVVGAHNAGLPQKRDRMWIRAILSDAMRDGCKSNQGRQSIQDKNWNCAPHARGRKKLKQGPFCPSYFRVRDWRVLESGVGRITYDVADYVDRIKAIGNGQVPAVAAIAWNVLGDILNERGDMN